MKTQKILLMIALVVASIVLGNLAIQNSEEIKAAQAENRALKSNMRQLERVNEHLIIQLVAANDVIEIQEPLVAEFKRLASFIDLDAFDMSKLENVARISEETPLDYEDALILVKYADQYELPYSLVLSIIDLESNFQKNLVGTSDDRGLMQIIPASERWLATQFGEELGLTYDPNRIFETEYNLALGIKYLDMLRDRYGDDYDRILSEYNRGPGNLARYYAAYNTYSTSYSRTVLSKQEKYLALND